MRSWSAGTAFIWRAREGRIVARTYPLSEHTSSFTPRASVTSCHYSSDGRLIVTCGTASNPVSVFHAHTLTPTNTTISGIAPWGNVILKPCIAGDG